MKYSLTASILAVLAVSHSADAVMLSAHGTGQVLVYPYYTVNHQQTLLSVVNTTANGKALKLRFREGYDGRDVANFNVYLGPNDEWVGSVFDSTNSDSGGATIATSDASCTVPALDTNNFPGLTVFRTSVSNYNGGAYGSVNGFDSGPIDLARTREGFLEIIEMGEVVDQATGSQSTLEAITPGTAKFNCARLQNAWAPGGYWSMNPSIDLLPPAGGLYGSESIVDVAQGTLYSVDAYAIDGFSDVAQHSNAGDAKPNLSTAITDSANHITTAFVPVGNTIVKADYPSATQAIDAVSAVFMADGLYNEYEIESGVGAQSDWLVTFPTKQFYVDPAIVGSGTSSYVQPFEEVFGGGVRGNDPVGSGSSALSLNFQTFSRDGAASSYVGCSFLCPYSPMPTFVYQVQVVPMGPAMNPLSEVLGSHLTTTTFMYGIDTFSSPSGHARVTFSQNALRPSLNHDLFVGVPLIGFLAVNYINSNVTPGVLSNYSGAYPHRTTVSCQNSANPPAPCQ